MSSTNLLFYNPNCNKSACTSNWFRLDSSSSSRTIPIPSYSNNSIMSSCIQCRFLIPQKSYCETGDSNQVLTTTTMMTPQHKHDHHLHLATTTTATTIANADRTEPPCDACFYTGIATCTGLTLYFLKTALVDLPAEQQLKGTTTTTAGQLRHNQRVLLGLSATSALAGVYRWYLG
jgi:hypothetical protein